MTDPLDNIEKRLRADQDREYGENYGLWWLNTGRNSCFVHQDGRWFVNKGVEQYLRKFDFNFTKGRKFISGGHERLLLIQERYRIDAVIEKSAVLDAGIHFYSGQKYLVFEGPKRPSAAPGEFPVTARLIAQSFPVEDRELFLAWARQTVCGYFNPSDHRFGPVLVLVGEHLDSVVPKFIGGLIGELTTPLMASVLNTKPKPLLANYGWFFPSGATGSKSKQLQNFFQLCTSPKLISRGDVWPAFGRGVVCLNEESYSLKPLEEYLWKPAKKLIILNCLFGSVQAEIWEQVMAERAAFLWYLRQEHEIPESLLDPADNSLKGYLSPIVDKKCFEGTDAYLFLTLLIEAFQYPRVVTEAKLLDYLETEGANHPETARSLLRKINFSATMQHLAARYPEHIIYQDSTLPKWLLKGLKRIDL